MSVKTDIPMHEPSGRCRFKVMSRLHKRAYAYNYTLVEARANRQRLQQKYGIPLQVHRGPDHELGETGL